jgi:chromosome segregation ATPase
MDYSKDELVSMLKKLIAYLEVDTDVKASLKEKDEEIEQLKQQLDDADSSIRDVASELKGSASELEGIDCSY